ncbi:hypothetical protein MAR_018888 [Mya arenaria]|uniref:B box-type domain-containing protein n=1 Tax=Mya arenaria TaxID=6604 RepID=A0ABY7EFY9_MYAAR|nr:hypothetical protein MAR_018888 [Mya arenaria]
MSEKINVHPVPGDMNQIEINNTDKEAVTERDTDADGVLTVSDGQDHNEKNGGHEKQGPKKWRGPPKNSNRYGIRHSLEKMAVKYIPPKIEGPKTPQNPCDPCLREKHCVEATNYCPECKERLCAMCTSQHKKFQILKTHKVLGVEDAPRPEVPKSEKIKCSETCKKHANKMLDLYCRAHDEVGCSACMAVNHKECPEPEYIVNAAPVILKSGLAKDFKEEICRVKQEVITLKMRRSGDKNRITKEKTQILEGIEGLRKKIMEILYSLEESAKEKLMTYYEKLSNGISNDMHDCESALAFLDRSMEKIKADSDAQLFIDIKKDGKASLRQGEHVIASVTEKLGQEEIKFTEDESIAEWISKLIALGKFDHEVSVFSGTFFGKYDLDEKSDTEKENYAFNSLLNLPNGFTIVSDWNNKRLKIIDTNYNLRSHCDTPEQTKMKLDRKFKIDEYCRGMAYKDNKLFVTCGGGEGEINGQLRVYSLHGALVRVFEEDVQSKPFFAQPKDVIVNDEGTRFHVLDLKRGVVTLSNDGRLVSVFRDPGLQTPLGICMDGKGNLFASGSDSNNVLQFNVEGKKLSEVLKESDGLTKPLAICCHEGVNPRLIVTFEGTCTVKVFTLQE